MPEPTVSFEDIQSAARVIRGAAHRTPVVTCRTLDEMAGCRLLFKCENLQKVGAFKFRGAFHAVSRLTDETAAAGVVTHSSGNHAQALALAARIRGVPAFVVMPESASPVKQAAVRDYGAEVVLCEPTLSAREATADEVRKRTGATFIHPYDHPHIIAGQGTATLELIEQVEKRGLSLSAVMTPVGGGGLLSGTAVAAHGSGRSIPVYAAEPAGADDAARSMEAGRLIPQTAPDTIADGLLTSLGELTWPIIREHVEQIVTVTDEQIVAAMRLLWERAKLLVEPSSAVVLAAVLDERFQRPPDTECIGLILSGGNVNLDRLPW